MGVHFNPSRLPSQPALHLRCHAVTLCERLVNALGNTSCPEPLSQFRGVRHEHRGLLDWVALCVSTSILTLITCRGLDSCLVHCTLDHGFLPRGGVGRVFVQEVTAVLQLLQIKLTTKLQVFHCPTFLRRNRHWASNLVIDPLPSAKCRAHW